MSSKTLYKQKSDCLILYILYHKASNAGPESTEILAPNMSGGTYIQLACHRSATL